MQAQVIEKDDRLRLERPAEMRSVPELRHCLVDAAEGCRGLDMAALELAIGEALANAVEHGAGGDVVVDCVVSPAGYWCDILNRCEPFCYSLEMPAPSSPRSRGFALMKRCVDELLIRFHRGWVVVSLVKFAPEPAQG